MIIMVLFSSGGRGIGVTSKMCTVRWCDVVYPWRQTLCYLAALSLSLSLMEAHVSMMSPSLLLSVNEAQSGAWSSTKPICRTHMRSRGDLWTARDSQAVSPRASSFTLRSDSLSLTLHTKCKKPKYGNRI